MQAWLTGLNNEQEFACTLTEGHVRVLAGPGTGKTRTLTSRYCYLTETLGISPKNILCVTFTNKAANEMKQLSKFWQYENGTYKNFMPVLRWSEMYYIAAEASLNTDSRQAVRYLNTVRNNRYLDFDPLDENLPVTQIQNEIYKEYRKELVGEGQLFYYYKRLNFASIPGSAVSGSDDIYVLPMPENEVEFGNRQ